MWRTYGAFVATSRYPYSAHTVSLPSSHRIWSYESYIYHAVAATFVTTTNPACKTVRFYKIIFRNRRTQNHTATIQRQHDMWPSHWHGRIPLECSKTDCKKKPGLHSEQVFNMQIIWNYQTSICFGQDEADFASRHYVGSRTFIHYVDRHLLINLLKSRIREIWV